MKKVLWGAFQPYLFNNGLQLRPTCCLSCTACWAVSRLFSRLAFRAALAASADSNISVFAFNCRQKRATLYYWWLYSIEDVLTSEPFFICLPEHPAGLLSPCCLQAVQWPLWLRFPGCVLGLGLNAAGSSAPGLARVDYPGLACCSLTGSLACLLTVSPLHSHIQYSTQII